MNRCRCARLISSISVYGDVWKNCSYFFVAFINKCSVFQATAEQIRLAQVIYDSNDTVFEDKVKQVREVNFIVMSVNAAWLLSKSVSMVAGPEVMFQITLRIQN